MSTTLALTALVCLLLGGLAGWLGHGRFTRSAAVDEERSSDALGRQVDDLVAPLRQTLDQLSAQMHRSESGRIAAQAGLSEQLRGMTVTAQRLQDQTARLAGALHAPQIRGRWGEVQLERIVELSGMSRHCDFTTQRSYADDDRTVRPDLTVHLAGGRSIIVDAKVPLQAWSDAAGPATDPDAARQRLRRHAQAVRAHVTALSGKAYWASQRQSPEFVVLFLPGDGALEAATRADPALLDYAFARNVVLATPSTLIALLRTVALGWRQHALAEDAAVIHDLGRQLYQRLDGVLGHLDKTGTALRRAVEAYNATIGAVDNRLGVTARRLAELEALSTVETSGNRLRDRPAAIDTTVRVPSRAD